MKAMKHWSWLLGMVLCASLVIAADPKKPAAKAAPSDPTVPMEKKDPSGKFQKMHQSFLERRKEPMQVLFLGDSITAGWAGSGKSVWEANYEKYQAANFGIGGDRTEHVLWRIQEGELDGIHP